MKMILILAVISVGCAGQNSTVGTAKAPPPCTTALVPGGAQISCSDGTSTFVANGIQGLPGQQGVQGDVGPTTNVATPVQLCPGVNTYPNTFVEQGLCINSKLYAVYSVNGGFLTYLPDGAYGSNAVGSSCNFTVTNGCTVSQ
jgi:hypothetical protein